MAVAELDLPQLSSFCSIPQPSLNTLITTPTADLVQTLLRNISAKAKDYQGLQSEKLRFGVELEAAVRGQETKSKSLKAQLEKSNNEAVAFKQKLQEHETARASLEAELHNLQTSTSNSTSDIEELKARVDSLENSNREKLSLLDAKSTAHDNLAAELEAQHQKIVELRKQVSTLEQSLEEERTALSAAKFREESQKHSIEQLNRRNDYLANELKTKAAEQTKFRKEKNQQVTQLERQNEEDSGRIRQLQATEANIRRTLEDVTEKADERSQRIQSLQEEFLQKEDTFQLELSSANRLAKLRENSATTERERAQDLTEQLNNVKEKASTEIGRIEAELDTEHIAKEEAENKVAELEVQVEHLQADLATLQDREVLPSTPQKGINGFHSQSPIIPEGSPSIFSPGSSRMKGSLSMTRLVSENNELKRQANVEKRRNEQLTSTIDGLMADMEHQSPVIEDLKTEHVRLESEVADLSSLVDSLGKERDQAVKAAKKQEGQVEAKMKEGEILRQQLRDLSSQMKMLLLESHLRDQEQPDLSAEGRAQLERLGRGEEVHESEGMTPADQYINKNLVSFRNIVELQEQNSQLLKLTREIGQRMEHEEALQKQSAEAHNWDELQEKYERCKDEIKSLVTQSQSYIRERDMFRDMLANRGQLSRNSDINSTSGERTTMHDSVQEQLMDSIEGNSSQQQTPDYAKLLKDMQAHFDAYRNEAATDRSTMKEQIDGLLKTNQNSRSEAMRYSSQAALANERNEMLQANYSMLKNENAELQQRSQTYYESAAKQDLRVSQAAEDLVEARGIIDSMRNETANLKAEKEFWKSVEKRITDDNDNLIHERGRLSSLNASLQSLLNEREHSDNDTRRRLQSRIDTLEADLQRTTTSLREESEESKRAASRREYETNQNQKRIDDLVTSLSRTREELAKTNTTKDHLSRQTEELSIELRSAKERLDVLQTASAPKSTANANEPNADGTQDGSLNQEQELSVKVSELQRDCDLLNNEVEDLKSQVEQYKAISQASEDELSSLNETQDMLRRDTDQLLGEKDAKIKELQQRNEDIAAELTSVNNEMGDLRNKQAEHERSLEDQSKTYETRLAQLKDEDERHAAQAKYYQEDLKKQAEIAREAQENYDRELVKHADARRDVQKIRGELSDVKVELVAAKTIAETARLNLTQNEESWAESKERLQRELTDLRTAQQDLKIQNDRLHQQFETLTAAKKRASEGQDQIEDGSANSSLEDIQEVVKYLRREKEIAEVQHEVSSQEAKRLKQQLDYTQLQLDETKLKLSQQKRSEAEVERSSLDHKKLMETIQDLNTHRESNVTLRAEVRQAQSSLAARSKELDELRAQLEPLKEEIQELRGERETHEAEVRLHKENADRWQERAQNVLQKYDRVDPAELEALKEQVKSLESERDELRASNQALQEQISTSNDQVSQAEEQTKERVETMRARLTEQFKGRSKQLSDRIKDKDTALQTAASEKQSLEERLSGLANLQAELEARTAERNSAIEQVAAAKVSKDTKTQNEGEEGEVDEAEGGISSSTATSEIQAKLEEAEARLKEEREAITAVQNELSMSKTKISELEGQIGELQATIKKIDTELSNAKQAQSQASVASNTDDLEAQLSRLKEDLAQAQAVNAFTANGPMEDGSKSVAEQVSEGADAVRQELERRHQERVKATEENYNKRLEGMKAQLSKKLAEGKAQIRKELAAEHESALQAVKSEHEQEVQNLQTRHNDEIDELKSHEEASLAELRATLEKEQQGSSAGPEAVKKEAQPSITDLQPTEQEVRAFVQSNEIVKQILRSNITNQVNKQKESLANRLKEEHERNLTQRLAEAQEKANTAKQQTVTMAVKKTELQLNGAKNRADITQFKLDIVQTAAQNTPQRPVKEVWDIAKEAKPSTSQTQQSTAKSVNPLTQRPPGLTTNAQQPTTQSTTKPTGAVSQPTRPAQMPPSSSPPAPQPSTQTAAVTPGVFGRPTPLQQSPPPSSPQSQQQQSAEAPPTQPSAATSTSGQRSGIPSGPQKQSQSGAGSQNAGAPNAAPRNQQSGLPVARGGASRAIPRGRGPSGIGRGGPVVDTSRAQGQPRGQSSPSSAGMNAGSKQFVPGNKRPREDSQDGPQGVEGAGKRIKGGVTE